MKKSRSIDDPEAGLKLLRKAELCQLLGISTWTIDDWIKSGQFPKPIYITPGSPARFRLVEVQRFIDSRANKRRKPILRGRLKRGTE